MNAATTQAGSIIKDCQWIFARSIPSLLDLIPDGKNGRFCPDNRCILPADVPLESPLDRKRC
jgi:hypothetical protein